MRPREQLLRDVFHAVVEGRAAEIAGALTDDFVFVSVVAGREFHGVEGLAEWHADVSAYYEDLGWEILEVTDLGAQDALRWRFAGRSRQSGVEFDTEMSQLWSYRGDRICRVEVFPDAGGAVSTRRQP